MVGYYKGSSIRIPAEYLIDNRFKVTKSGNWIIWDLETDTYVDEATTLAKVKKIISKITTER